jgi:hypothetical protein
MPNEASARTDDSWSATVAAAILRRGSMVHVASLILTVAALLCCAMATTFAPEHRLLWLAAAAVVLAAGVVESWLAARVLLDADLFDAIAASGGDLEGFDRAMVNLGLMRIDKASRALVARIASALRLLKLQLAALGLQLGVFVAGILFA